MAFGMQAFKEDSSLLFDTNYLVYGLLKSAPLTRTHWWGFHDYKSANLDPTDESSYAYGSLTDPVCAVTVYDSISPIAFVSGYAQQCGETLSGNARTMFFRGFDPGAKVYIFDIIRDLGDRTGMQCFTDNGTLAFSTDMPPLNIVAAIDPPAISPRTPNSPQYDVPNGPVYTGGSSYDRTLSWSGGGVTQVSERIFYADVAHSHGDCAAYLNFSRGCGYGAGTTFWIAGGSEGCGGLNGSVRFYFGWAAATTRRIGSNPTTTCWDIPRDRQPTALVIRTSDYPYPFR